MSPRPAPSPFPTSCARASRLGTWTLVRLGLVALWSIVSPLASWAEIFWVSDVAPVGKGSLYQAILDANANPGPDTIRFAFPGPTAEIWCDRELPEITETLVIDGRSQEGYAGRPLVSVNNAFSAVNLNFSNAPNSAVYGLAFQCIGAEIFLDAAIRFLRSDDSIVQGCWIGFDVRGVPQSGFPVPAGIRVSDCRRVKIGAAGEWGRNVISACAVGIDIVGGDDNRILNNLLGTDVTGTTGVPISSVGIILSASTANTQIGGSNPSEANVISGHSWNGISVVSASRTLIVGNHIGTRSDGVTPLGNGNQGILVFGRAQGTVVSGNTIAHNTRHGICVMAGGGGGRFTGNRMFENGALGIDLGATAGAEGDGVTPNDAGDADLGGNELQNHPVISFVGSRDAVTVVRGTLSSRPLSEYLIEFFWSPRCDPSGHGEGRHGFGTTTVTTDALGSAVFDASFPVAITNLAVVTATATDAHGNTSEFSPCSQVNRPITIHFQPSGFAGGLVGLRFDRRLDPVSVSDPSRFAVTSAQGVHAVRGVSMGADGMNVSLIIDPYLPAGPGVFDVRVEGLRELQGSELSGVAQGLVTDFALAELGGSKASSFATVVAPGAVEVTTTHPYAPLSSEDALPFVHWPKALPGDWRIWGNLGEPRAGAAILIAARASLDPGSPMVAIVRDAGSGSLRLVGRDSPGAPARELAGPRPWDGATWLALRRGGNAFVAETSADGRSWKPVFQSDPAAFALSAPLLAGFGVGAALAKEPVTAGISGLGIMELREVSVGASDVLLQACGSGAEARYPSPTLRGFCDAPVVVKYDPPEGTVLPVGTHGVVVTATGDCGESASARFTVTVKPDERPLVMECKPDRLVEAAEAWRFDDPVAMDPCLGIPLPVVVSSTVTNPLCGSSFSVTRTWTATDSRKWTASCSQTIRSLDTQPPKISCPANMVVRASGPTGAIVSFAVSAADAADPAPRIECVPPSGSLFPIGDTRVRCVAVDACGNRSECEFLVSVKQENCLDFKCPTDVVVDCEGGQGAMVKYALPGGLDRCTGEPLRWKTFPEPGWFPVGVTVVQCWGPILSNGESAYCEFKVTVRDSCPPSKCLALTCPKDLRVPCEGPKGTVVHYEIRATNACGKDLEVSCSPPSGSRFPPGQTEVVCVARGDGEVQECRFRVEVFGACVPALTVVPAGTPGAWELSWPTADGFVPQQAGALGDAAVWRPVKGPIHADGPVSRTTVVPEGAASFFRLLRPLAPRPAFPKPAVVEVDPVRHSLREIVVKAREGTRLRLAAGSLAFNPASLGETDRALLRRVSLTDGQVASDVTVINALVASTPGAVLQPLVGGMSEVRLGQSKQTGEAMGGEELADMNLYFLLFLPSGTPEAVQDIVEVLNTLATVEIAYPQTRPEGARLDAPPRTADLRIRQGYRSSAPSGIDVECAWDFRGGRGDGIRVVDIESNWHLDHEDLPGRPFYSDGIFSDLCPGPWCDEARDEHGTAVLGILVADENEFGVTGIVPRAEYGVGSFLTVSLVPPSIGIAAAILRAGAEMRRGDVMVIPLGVPGPDTGVPCVCNMSQCGMMPVELLPAEWDAIRTLTRNGIVVVESAGNGSVNLDHPVFGGRFDRRHRAFRDSGAIMVGASAGGATSGGDDGSSDTTCWSNHGSRVDVRAWGGNVVTLGYGDYRADGDSPDQWYALDFGGTSSAAPIVAGAVASIQGILKAREQPPLLPDAVRELLSRTGSRQFNNAWNNSRPVGPQPDLEAALADVLPQWAEFVLQVVPDQLVAGGSGEATIVLRNRGTTTWMPGRHALIAQNPANNSTWGVSRVDLPAPVPPGGTHSFTFPFTAPLAAGTYAFQWRLMDDGREPVGCRTPNLSIRVGEPPVFQPLGDFQVGGPPVVFPNGDGRLEVFVSEAAGFGFLLHCFQLIPNGREYSGWERMGLAPIKPGSSPAVARNRDNRLEVLMASGSAAEVDAGLAQMYQTAPNARSERQWAAENWFSFTDPRVLGDPCLVANADGRLELFATGADNRLWRRSQAGVAGGAFLFWFQLADAAPVGSPGAVRDPAGRLHVFVRWADGSVRRASQRSPGGDWTPWDTLGGIVDGDPVPVVGADGMIRVLVRGADGRLLEQRSLADGRFPGAWAAMSDPMIGRPAVAVHDDGSLDVIVTRADGVVASIPQAGPRGEWRPPRILGDGATSQPAVGRHANSGELEVFVRRSDGRLWHIRQPSMGQWR